MKRLLLGLLPLFFCVNARALVVPDVYYSGPEICERNPALRTDEIPLWIQVPLDYHNPDLGMTEIYAWLKNPLDPEKDTMIFVNGGPGDTSHSSRLDLDNWNVIFFDQRGNTCSKPPTRDVYLSRSFYSSENTARDINEIRKFLSLEQISLYGLSYGSIPAHLYASLFPENTRALVLEATVFQGDQALTEPGRRRTLLQKFFNSLPLQKQQRILELSQRPDLPGNWFSTIGGLMLYTEQGAENYSQFLDGIIWDETMVTSMLGAFRSQEGEDTEFGFGDVMLGMIGCQELGMNSRDISFSSVFERDQLVADPRQNLKVTYCRSLGFQDYETNRTFIASDFPVQVPVTYFQGSYDGAAASTQSIQHLKNASKGFAQLLISTNSGLLPLNAKVASYSDYPTLSTRLHRQMLEQALSGHEISSRLVEQLNALPDNSWVSLNAAVLREDPVTSSAEVDAPSSAVPPTELTTTQTRNENPILLGELTPLQEQLGSEVPAVEDQAPAPEAQATSQVEPEAPVMENEALPTETEPQRLTESPSQTESLAPVRRFEESVKAE